jgi:hypothetical protein
MTSHTFNGVTATASELNWWIAYGLKMIDIAKSELIYGEITESQYQTIVSTYTQQQAEFDAVLNSQQAH